MSRPWCWSAGGAGSAAVRRARLGIFCLAVIPQGQAMAQGTPDRLPIQPARTITFETTEGTFMNVDLSPDGRTIVFDLLGDIYTVPVQGGAATQRTRGLSYDSYPVWSPDGRQIAYVSDGTGSENLWVMAADGTGRRPVTTERVAWNAGVQPRFAAVEWTRDGRALVSDSTLYHLAGGKAALPWPIAGPAPFSPDGRYFYFTHEGVRRYDRETGATIQLARPPVTTILPVVSPDGRWLAYITGGNPDSSDVRDIGPTNGLRIRNLTTGEDRWLAYPIDKRRTSRWLRRPWAPHERYVFTPDSKAILLGFGGKLHRIDVATGADVVIPFTATVQVDLGPFAYQQYRLTNDSLAVRYIRSPDVSPDGTTLVFSALQRLYTMALPHGTPKQLVQQPGGQFHPAYSPDGRWIAYVTWSDVEGGHVWRVPARGGTPQRLTAVSGYYQRPAWSPDGATLAILEGDPIAQRYRNWGMEGSLQLIPSMGGTPHMIGRANRETPATFTSDGQRLLFQDGGGRLVSTGLDGHDRRELARVISPGEGTQVVPSPDGRYVAYVLREELYLAPLPWGFDTVPLGDSTGAVPSIRLTHGGALDPRWERGGEMLTWVSANRFHRMNPDCAMTSVVHTRETCDTARALPSGGNAASIPHAAPDEAIFIHLAVPRHVAHGTLALRGARVITMKGQEVLEDATVVITNDRVTAVGPSQIVRVPHGATVLDVRGKTIMPGLVDLHAHFREPRDLFFQSHWKYLVNLAYGVTTARDPAANTDQFGYAELVEAGRLLGPRLFSVGGAAEPRRARIESLEDARALVQRRKAMGAVVIKQYAQPTRRQRQWLLLAAQEAGLNVTNEGASDSRLDLTMVLDGFTGVEHNLPEVNLFSDVTRLIAEAKTWYTPTLQVAYPLMSGGDYFRNRHRMHDDRKYRRFVPHSWVDQLRAGALLRAADDQHFVDIARQVAEIRHRGGHVTLGSHGDTQGIAAHWELWALQMGGLTTHEALQAATLRGAEALGVQQDLGSIEVGKLADLLVLDRNPLENIEHTVAIRYVMKNGVLYDGDTLDMVWPRQQRLPSWMYFQDDMPPRSKPSRAEVKTLGRRATPK